MKRYGHFIPIAIILILMIVVFFSGVLKELTFENLKNYRHQLILFVHQHPFLSPFAFILIYIGVAALSLPIGIYMTFVGGFLFPQPWSTFYVVFGATLGASIIFLAARTAVGDFLRRKATPFLISLEEGFQKNAVNYMLFLRLIPFFPFWLVNLASAIFEIPFFTFFWTTAVGMIIPTFVFTQVGAGLGAIFDTQGAFSLDAVLNRDIKIALSALGILALLPIMVNYWKSRASKQS